MDCETMINIYKQCGGFMYCNYKNKQCSVKGTNLQCVLKTENDMFALDRLLWENMRNGNIDVNDKRIEESIPIIHKFQYSRAKSITINTLFKNDKNN